MKTCKFLTDRERQRNERHWYLFNSSNLIHYMIVCLKPASVFLLKLDGNGEDANMLLGY